MGQHARLTNYDMSRKLTSKIFQSVIVKPTKAPEDSTIEELKSKIAEIECNHQRGAASALR